MDKEPSCEHCGRLRGVMIGMEQKLTLCARCWLEGVGTKHKPVLASGKKAKKGEAT